MEDIGIAINSLRVSQGFIIVGLVVITILILIILAYNIKTISKLALGEHNIKILFSANESRKKDIEKIEKKFDDYIKHNNTEIKDLKSNLEFWIRNKD